MPGALSGGLSANEVIAVDWFCVGVADASATYATTATAATTYSHSMTLALIASTSKAHLHVSILLFHPHFLPHRLVFAGR